MDIEALKVADLKRELKARNLAVSGTKAELAERLKAATNNEDGFEGADEGLPEGDLSDGEEALLNEDALLDNGTVTKTTEESPVKESLVAQVPANGNNNIKTAATLLKEGVLTPLEDNIFVSPEADAQKEIPVPVSVDKLKARAARFGLPAAKLEERAKKFGITPTAVESNKSKPNRLGAAPAVDKQKLLDRAKRFGLSVGDDGKLNKPEPVAKTAKEPVVEPTQTKPTAAMKAEDLEKLKKRAQRFGGNVSAFAIKADDARKLELRKVKFQAASAPQATADNKATVADPELAPSEPKKRKPIVF